MEIGKNSWMKIGGDYKWIDMSRLVGIEKGRYVAGETQDWLAILVMSGGARIKVDKVIDDMVEIIFSCSCPPITKEKPDIEEVRHALSRLQEFFKVE